MTGDNPESSETKLLRRIWRQLRKMSEGGGAVKTKRRKRKGKRGRGRKGQEPAALTGGEALKSGQEGEAPAPVAAESLAALATAPEVTEPARRKREPNPGMLLPPIRLKHRLPHAQADKDGILRIDVSDSPDITVSVRPGVEGIQASGGKVVIAPKELGQFEVEVKNGETPLGVFTVDHVAQSGTGINTESIDYWGNTPFEDRIKCAALNVGGKTVGEDKSVPLDKNGFPTDTGVVINWLFYAGTAKVWPDGERGVGNTIRDGKYVVFYDGNMEAYDVSGKGISNIKLVREGRVEFDAVFPKDNSGGNFTLKYKIPDGKTCTNVRLVHESVAEDYAGWRWVDYIPPTAAGVSSNNPPIFMPEWLDKMSNYLIIRYMDARVTNDWHAVKYKRDQWEHRPGVASSTWYTDLRHREVNKPQKSSVSGVWPWEMIAEASHQTGAIPWLNFAVYTWDNMIEGDPIVENVANLMSEQWGKQCYLEYANEVWNVHNVFSVGTKHCNDNGPIAKDDKNEYPRDENFGIRAAQVYERFKESYINPSLALGVLPRQQRNTSTAKASLKGIQSLPDGAIDAIDALGGAIYIGEDANAGAKDGAGDDIWNWWKAKAEAVKSNPSTIEKVFDSIRDDLLNGPVNKKNWNNDIKKFTAEYIKIANDIDKGTIWYEGGLHVSVYGFDKDDEAHRDVVLFMDEFVRSPQHRDVQKAVDDWLLKQNAGVRCLFTFGSCGAPTGCWRLYAGQIEADDAIMSVTQHYEDFNDIHDLHHEF